MIDKGNKAFVKLRKKMRQDLTTKNENTLYVVFDTKNDKVLLETEDKTEALSFVNRTANTDYSTYPPFSYASNKKNLGDLYETTFLEY